MGAHSRIRAIAYGFAMTSPPLLLLLLLKTLLVRHGSGDQCLTSWVSNHIISQQAAHLGELTDVDSKDQWLFPQLNVTCSTTITKLMFIGEFIQEGNKVPDLQMWRRTSLTSSRYSKAHHTQGGDVVTVVQSNMYAVLVSWQVQQGDVFGVHQPDLRKSRYGFTMQERGGGELSYVLRNQRRAPHRFDTSRRATVGHPYPLVHVEADDGECISGFVNLLTLITKAKVKSGLVQQSTLYSNSNKISIFPAIKFGCNGRISQALFAAEPKESTSVSTSHAELQLWSELRVSSVRIPGSYNRTNQASLEGARATADLNVYEKSFSQPLKFEEGDILGLYLPLEGCSSLQLFLQGGPLASSVPSYSIQQSNSFTFNTNNAESDNGVPLISLNIIADCEQPASPVHGKVTMSSITDGHLALYQCDDGYKLVGQRERTCAPSDGQWTHSDPICYPVYCECAPVPANGQVVYDNSNRSTLVNSTVTYGCDMGFELSGSKIRQCTASGNWSGSSPTCIGIQCGELDRPIKGGIEIQLTIPGTQLDAHAIYNCSAGHTLVGEKMRVCSEDKTWNGSAPQCFPDCLSPPNIRNGELIQPLEGTPLHSVVEYSCNTGTRMIGNQTLRCLENGQWSSDPPTCADITCDPLENPRNGAVSSNNGTVYGSQAHYNCNSNFFLKGNHLRSCQETGKWSGKMPKCIYRGGGDVTVGEARNREDPPSTAATFLLMSTNSNAMSFQSLEMAVQDMVIAIVIAVLCVVIVCMIVAITGVYFRRRKHKRVLDQSMAVAIADLQDNSIDNPMYGGDHRFSFNFWDPHTTPAPPSPDGDDTTLYSNPAYHDCDYPASTKTRATGKSLYYDVSSLLNPMADLSQHYKVMDCETHYETASNFQFELPALPYEVPTPSNKYPPTTIYGSLPWGTYVPTKEERSAIYDNIPATSSTHVSLKSHGSLTSLQAFFQECEIYWKPASDSASLYEQLAKNKYREILRHQIQITENLGSGQFGRVAKGLWQSQVGVIPVAVKTLKEGMKESDEVRFLQEAAINGQFQHRNVVKLHGVVTLGRPVMIVLELCPNGDLRDYLIQARPSLGEIMASDWPQRLLQFCGDVACGMEYLSRKAFIHRDLAARNILITEDKTCKISDFGLSRDLEHENYYISHGGKIPVKWTAPEAIHYKKYSTASDVWSFGCVMYEIWSLGHKPFEEHANLEAIAMIDRGFRLPPPPGCLKPIYSLMIQCWHPDSSHRPSFSVLFHSLKDLDIRYPPQHKEQNDGCNELLQLGAPLNLGKNLHPDLQNLYTKHV